MSVRVFPMRALAAALALACGGAAVAHADPSIMLNPTHIDLGVIQEGTQYERFIEVSNRGDGTLVVTDVKTSCGCTAATVDGVVELTKGQTQKIRVTFDSKHMDGHVKKNVIISSNDPALPKVSVPLEADVHMAIKWTPKYITMNRIGPNMPFKQVVQLHSDKQLGLQVKNAFIRGGTLGTAPTKIFDLETNPARVEGDRDVHEFAVTLREGVKPQKITESLQVVTNLPAPNDTLRLPIRGEILGRITVSPNFAVLPLVNPGEMGARDLTFRASSGTFNVVHAEVADSPVTTEIHADDTGQQTVIRLIYKGEAEGVNGMRTLRVETDDPEQRFIEVPVRYQTRDPNAAAPHREAATVGTKKSQGPN
jgi:Protein of unknown function (DUF1573)